MTRFLTIVLCLALGGVAVAQTPDADPAFRAGANHHFGDEEFRAKLGRYPRPGDERLLMETHFEAVRAWLRSRPATKPELAARRAELLGYLDEYAAKGITPKNTHLPWRTPVFIDDSGTICAVGYLIEKTAGRAEAEKIASEHRYSYIEEIAAAMPEVRDWVAASGFTLDEIGAIQPGYMGPSIDHVEAWNPKKDKVPDGEFVKQPSENDGTDVTVHGTIARGQMTGAWTVTTKDGHVVGKGELARGAGTWTSYFADGTVLAEGRFANNQPAGTWKIYHPSGNLAAVGRLSHGARDGEWKFYYDAKPAHLIAIGSFAGADLAGTWRHFDASGHLLATEHATGNAWKDGVEGMFTLDIVPGADGVRHRVEEGNVAGDSTRLDEIESADRKDKIFVRDTAHVFDADGFTLLEKDGGLVAADCHWSAPRKLAARRGELSRLHQLVFRDAFGADENADDCGAETPVPPERAARLQALLSSVRAVRAQSPDFVRDLALGNTTVDDATDPQHKTDDLAEVLAANMTWYVEWPHIDHPFYELYGTLAGVQLGGQ